MKLIHTTDGGCYRRWVNLIPSFLLPGSVQFLSGRRTAGVACFLSYLVGAAVLVAYLVHPQSPYSVVSMGPYDWALPALTLAIAVDGLRRPIRCLRVKGWALFLCVWLGVLILPALAVRTFLVRPFSVPTGGMRPTIMGNRKDAGGTRLPGDCLIVNVLAYRFSEPQRGDVVVFKTRGIKSLKLDTCYVQRLAGLPGETICIDPPFLVADGKRVTEPAIFRNMEEGKDGFSGFHLASPRTPPPVFLKSPEDKIVLGPDEYLVLGDNTTNSFDGRYFGPIRRDAIIGKAFYIYAPAGRKRRIE